MDDTSNILLCVCDKTNWEQCLCDLDSKKFQVKKVHMVRNTAQKKTTEVATFRFPKGIMKRAGMAEYKSMGQFLRESMIKSIAEREGKTVELVKYELGLDASIKTLDELLEEYKKSELKEE